VLKIEVVDLVVDADVDTLVAVKKLVDLVTSYNVAYVNVVDFDVPNAVLYDVVVAFDSIDPVPVLNTVDVRVWYALWYIVVLVVATLVSNTVDV
jgi:hypothetical protein